MIELGQLERAHEEFAKRKVRVVVSSLEDQSTVRETRAQFPHLVVLADEKGDLARAIEVIDPGSNPYGGDTSAPTTLIVDGTGRVRWTFRPDSFLTRATPGQILEALKQALPSTGGS